MAVTVREMHADEVHLIPDYFHAATAEYLEMLGVDPTRLPSPSSWTRRCLEELGRPDSERTSFLVLWERDGAPVGFSTADRVRYGDHAYMHLHVIVEGERRAGIGSTCVPLTAELYLDRLRLKRIFCEPNAFNIAPNRTLAAAGFRYVKTHRTVPGPLNYHQPVTRWVFE